MAYTAITCAGDNTVQLTPLPPKVLAKKGLPGGAMLWLSMLVGLLAYVLHAVPSLQPLLLPAALQPLAGAILGL